MKEHYGEFREDGSTLDNTPEFNRPLILPLDYVSVSNYDHRNYGFAGIVSSVETSIGRNRGGPRVGVTPIHEPNKTIYVLSSHLELVAPYANARIKLEQKFGSVLYLHDRISNGEQTGYIIKIEDRRKHDNLRFTFVSDNLEPHIGSLATANNQAVPSNDIRKITLCDHSTVQLLTGLVEKEVKFKDFTRHFLFRAYSKDIELVERFPPNELLKDE